MIWLIPDLEFPPVVLDSPNPLRKAIVPSEAVTMFVNGEPAVEVEIIGRADGTFELWGQAATWLEVGSQNVVTVVYTDEDIVHSDAATFFILEDSQ